MPKQHQGCYFSYYM